MIVLAGYDGIEVTIPDTAYTLDGFRDWVNSDDFPERGLITYFQGDVIVDMSPERIESHNKVKAEIGRVLGNLVRQLDCGVFYTDRLWFTNDDANLSTEPDASFATWETLESGRFKLIPSTQHGQDGLEMRGRPDWVVEVISKSSVKKDKEILFKAYREAGVGEYWLIDARGDDLQFEVFNLAGDEFVQAMLSDDWIASKVFGHEFSLTRDRDRIGGRQYTLHVRTAAT